MTLEKDLLSLARKWEEEALEQVPEDYIVRQMKHKYLRLDNEAAGLWSCATELRQVLIRSAQLPLEPSKSIQPASLPEEEKCINCGEYDCRCADYDRAQVS